LKYSEKAFHDVISSRSECTPGTREKILKKIMDWAKLSSNDTPLGYWMCGMAGTGKSTIAQSICNTLENEGLLAGSFFCSRQTDGCSNYDSIIPTIAYQLGRYSRTFAEGLLKALESDPDLASKNASKQIQKLLIDPWKSVITAKSFQHSTPVVVIDALDECKGIHQLLQVLVPAIQKGDMTGLKFFFTSRPEKNVSDHLTVQTPLNEGLLLENFYLHNVEESLVQADIAIFLEHRLQGVAIMPEQLRSLIHSSGKLFIYAATLVKYITGSPGWEQDRLAHVLDIKHSPKRHQTEVLDSLYYGILSNAFSSEEEEQKKSLTIVHTAISAGKRISCKVLADLLGYSDTLVETIVNTLGSVLYINNADQGIYTFHASFADYINSETRAESMHCNALIHHSLLTDKCLDLMESKLRFNICDLPSSFVPDNEVPGIVEKVAGRLKGALEYSCVFWAYHLKEGDLIDSTMEKLERFLEEKVIYWVEAMNLLKEIAKCINILDIVLQVSAI
jgi:hypothetical protein